MIKKLNIILAFLFTIIISNAVVVVEKTANTPEIQSSSSGISQVVAGGVMTGVIVGVIIGIVILIIYFIVKRISIKERKNTDLLFSKYKIELDKCNHNRDKRLKWRNWKTFFLTFKRAEILLDTEQGLKFYGYYNGEMIQKDKFFLISTYKIEGLFKRDIDILIIPYEVRTRIKKELINGKWTMIIKAESVDEALNTDYYTQLVFSDTKNKDKLIDFNEYIQKTYLEKYILRQVIKDNLLDFKQSMDKAVELNPNIQLERKNPKN